MDILPKEKLQFFRINARVAISYAPCAYCGQVTTRGRDWLGDGQCDDCLIKIIQCDDCLIKIINDMKGDVERNFKEPAE